VISGLIASVQAEQLLGVSDQQLVGLLQGFERVGTGCRWSIIIWCLPDARRPALVDRRATGMSSLWTGARAWIRTRSAAGAYS
jgi:hypothetical protein